MDIQTSLIYVGIVGACAAVVFAVSMFGIKEKTYDEAIAEQRQMPNEHLLLARSKEKNKDKKQKKAAGKKVKEKPAEPEASEVGTHEKHHVEFEPEEEILTEPPPQDEKKTKKKKMKPILVNKSEHLVGTQTAAAMPNHFEQSLPKDDLLLKRQLSREDVTKPAAVKSASGKVTAVKEKVVEKLVEAASVVKLEESLPPPVVAKEQRPPPVVTKEQRPPPVVAKEQRPRKKRSELATLQQMTGDREGINVSVIVPLVQKAELSRSEIQILIDLLLNKQQESAVTNSEWSEGRQDPVVRLKKALAEKEKALSDEQEAAQAFQNKMKELRAELNTERSRWRHLEEAVGAKQLELQHANTRLQHAQEAHKNDKANMSQQLQQLQAQLSEERSRLRQLQEEQGQSQGALNVQRQQLELHIAHLSDQHKDAEGTMAAQLNQLHGQLQEMEKVSAAEVKMYRDQAAHLSNQVQQHENMARDLGHQLEETCRVKCQLEHHVTTLESHKDKLRKEVESVNYAYAKSSEAHKSDSARLVAEQEKLVATVKDLQANTLQVKEELSVALRDCQQLREENESLAAHVTAVTERPAAEGRENGDTSYPEEKPAKKEDSVKLLQAEVQELTSQVNTYKTEIGQLNANISQLNADLETQRTKNNELRTRNWKAMEAVAAAEKSLETQLKLVDSSSAAVRLEEQTATKQLLARLFPHVKVAACEPHATWVQRFVSAAQANPAQADLAQVDPAHVAQLEGAVANYKTIIQDTELLLTKLQNSAEEEEVKWREKLLRQEAQLDEVREERDRLAESMEEEQERLRRELGAAQEASRDMSKELVKLRSQLQIGQASLSQEHQLTQQLQQQVDKLNGLNEKQIAVATNGANTETSITESLCVTSERLLESKPKTSLGKKKKGGSGKK